MSARAVLRLRQDDASIWSNWDLIVSIYSPPSQDKTNSPDDNMGSHAPATRGRRRNDTSRWYSTISHALNHLLTRLVADLRLIQTQLSTLKRSDPSTFSIHGVLAERLQSGIQSMHTPPDNGPDFAFPAPNMDYTWTIFDQQIMNLANPPWLFDDSSLAPP